MERMTILLLKRFIQTNRQGRTSTDRDKQIRAMILEIPTTLQDLSTLDNSMAQMIMETINNMLIELEKWRYYGG